MKYPPGFRILEKRVYTPGSPVQGSESRTGMMDALLQKGFHKIGDGGFSTVWESPTYPGFVFKLFDDYAYLKYLSATKNSNNPHFPRVGKQYQYQVPITKGILRGMQYGCFVEKLTDDPPSSLEYYVDLLTKYYMWVQMGDKKEGRDPEFRNIERRWPQWRAACMTIVSLIKQNPHGRGKSGNRMEHDVYPKNVLWRGDVPVFSDPVWEEKPDIIYWD